MTYCHPFVQCQWALPFWDTAISKFDHENPWSRSCVWSKVEVTFDLQNSKVKVMVKVKPIGHIWGLEFNRYVCFSFRGNQTTFGWDIGNSIFDLENSRSRSWPRSNPTVTFEALEFNRCVYFSFRGNQTTFGWDKGNSILDLKNSRSRSWPRSNPTVTFEALEFNQYVYFSFRGNQTIFGWDMANSIFDLANLGQGHGQGQTRWSHLSPRIQSICLLFVSWQSNHFWLRYGKFCIWPWKI